MNRQNLPLIMMLVAGVVTCIVNLINHNTVLGQLTSLLMVLVIFYLGGSVLRWTLNYFDDQNEKEKQEAAEEGEVAAEDSEESEN